MRELLNNMKTKVTGCLRLIYKKKDHHSLIAVAIYTMPIGLGKFRHALEFDLRKKGHRCINGTLPYGSGNFGHNPLEKFFVNWENFGEKH